MRKILLLAASFAVGLAAVQAQKPAPAYLFSEVLMRQCGIADYTHEKFDFSRLPTNRTISSFWELRDTVRHPEKRHLISARIFAGGEPLTTLRWQLSSEVVRKDTVTKLFVYNDALECTLVHNAAPGISDAEAARLRDSMARLTALEDPDGHLLSILPAEQGGGAYALQYLLARAGIDAAPIFSYRTTLWNEDLRPLLGRVLRPGKAMRIGSDIERFARKARFEEGCVYSLVTENETRTPLFFFRADGKFWLKYGASQYVTVPSIVEVWRLCRQATKVVPYTLDPAFGRSGAQ